MTIFNTMVAFFEADDWPFDRVNDVHAVRTGFSGENGKWMCYAHAREESQQFVFYSVLPANIPLARREAVAEFITRANYGLILGNFELNYDDGEVRYKTSVDVEGAELTFSIIRQLVYQNVENMDRYLPGFMSIIYAGVDPKDAIGRIEDED